MEVANLSNRLDAGKLPFVSHKPGPLGVNDPVRFDRIKKSKKACQSIAIAGVTGENAAAVLRDLIRSARRLRWGLRGKKADVMESTETVNTTLAEFGFDMTEEGKEGFDNYDYASETVIVSYLIKRKFKDVTGTVVYGKTAKNMYVSTFCSQASPGRYVLMTAGHAIGVILAGDVKARKCRFFDGDAGEGELAEGSKHKAIISVFTP